MAPRGATRARRSPGRRSADRFDVATTAIAASDTTGAGDAFGAGFLVAWLGVEPSARHRPATLRRAVMAAHRAAARQLLAQPRELVL